MEVTLLGTGAPLAPDRATLGLLLRAPGEQPLLIDCCGGLELARQLARVGQPIDELTQVVVTHRHGDHIGGSMALTLARAPVRYYGLADALEGVLSLLETTYGEYDRHPDTSFQTVVPGRSLQLGGFNLRFFAVEHRVPTVAVRVAYQGKVLAYSADGLPGPAMVECAQQADLFVCDAICATGDLDASRLAFLMHPTALQAAQMARQAGVRQLALVHLGRFADTGAMWAEATGVFEGPLSIPPDLTRFSLV